MIILGQVENAYSRFVRNVGIFLPTAFRHDPGDNNLKIISVNTDTFWPSQDQIYRTVILVCQNCSILSNVNDLRFSQPWYLRSQVSCNIKL